MFNYYNAKRVDIASRLKPGLDAGGLKRDAEGKIHIVNTFPVGAGHWYRSSSKNIGKHCSYLFSICFKEFGFIHSQCMNCYKVAAKIETFAQLMQVKEIQEEMDVPSKVGFDSRPYTKAQYGAFWYNDGLEDGLDMLERVREKLEPLGIEVFLKRACTEFENRFGDSLTWHKTEPELAFEKQMDDLFVLGDFAHEQPDWIGDHIMVNWVEFAHSRGDMTYLPYTNGMPLYPAYRTYERDGVTPEQYMKEQREKIAQLIKERNEA